MQPEVTGHLGSPLPVVPSSTMPCRAVLPRGAKWLAAAMPGGLIAGRMLRRDASNRGKLQVQSRDRMAPSEAAQAWEELQRQRPNPMEQAASRAKMPAWLQEAAKDPAAGQKVNAQSTPGNDVEVVPDSVPGASKANFSRIYAREEWDGEALSGLGSREETTREFRSFLENFLREQRIQSVVDAGCGHWPSGYQRFMDWQGVHYTGVDVVPYVVEENEKYFQDAAVLRSYGLKTANFQCGDVSETLPEADLLLVKDVLMHLPNRAVFDFLAKSVNAKSPRYKTVMLVQNATPPVAIREMVDIQPGQLLPFDITFPPFKATFSTVLRWQSDEPKVVQIWTP